MKMNPETNITSLLLLLATTGLSLLPPTTSTPTDTNTTTSPSTLVIISRFAEPIQWLENKDGTPILPTRIYQKATPSPTTGRPEFPGLLPTATPLDFPDWADKDTYSPSSSSMKGKKENSTNIVKVKSLSSIPLHIVPNRAVESMAYVAAILDLDWSNDTNMPDLLVFIHGHRTSWHTVLSQELFLKRLAAFPPSPTVINDIYNGYLPFNCLEKELSPPSFVNTKNYDANADTLTAQRWRENLVGTVRQAWREVFQKHLGDIPDLIELPCCASFITTKEAIKSRPRQFYVDLRDWMLNGVGNGPTMDDKQQGLSIEMTWGLIFAGKAIINVDQEHCLCGAYSVCSSV
jgi:hypothetical protein